MNWMIDGVHKDGQSITSDWKRVDLRLIDGVLIKEVLNVPKRTGYLTEVYRASWELDDRPVAQVFQVMLNAGAISAWHAHAKTTDRLFVNLGLIRIVLHDTREGSPTRGVTNEFCFGAVRPALVTIPPRVWHGVQNVSANASLLLNLVDHAYEYDDPDHWRVPYDSDAIPFRF